MKPSASKKMSAMETRISMAVLILLAAIGAGVYVRQFQINPAVEALRPASHSPIQTTVAEKAPLIDVTDLGIVPHTPPERFGPDTLYEKIDGRADLYLSSGFVSLMTQRFAPDTNSDRWVEMFVYDMGNAENAYSVFTQQRREDAQSVDFGRSAYRTPNALFAVQGNRYLEWIGTDGSRELGNAMERLARRFLETNTTAAAANTPGADLFPPINLEPHSIRLILANAFGYEYLDRVYTAQYRIEGRRITAFVSRRQSAQQATELVRQHGQTLITYGARVVDTDSLVQGAMAVRFFDTHELFFSRGRHLAGIHEAGNLELARELARRLAGHLEEVQ